jgi:hypothetical protein
VAIVFFQCLHEFGPRFLVFAFGGKLRCRHVSTSV